MPAAQNNLRERERTGCIERLTHFTCSCCCSRLRVHIILITLQRVLVFCDDSIQSYNHKLHRNRYYSRFENRYYGFLLQAVTTVTSTDSADDTFVMTFHCGIVEDEKEEGKPTIPDTPLKPDKPRASRSSWQHATLWKPVASLGSVSSNKNKLKCCRTASRILPKLLDHHFLD